MIMPIACALACLPWRSARAGRRADAKPWLDPALLAAAQKEGTLVVYSSTNEREGLALFKLFASATGIKVNTCAPPTTC